MQPSKDELQKRIKALNSVDAANEQNRKLHCVIRASPPEYKVVIEGLAEADARIISELNYLNVVYGDRYPLTPSQKVQVCTSTCP